MQMTNEEIVRDYKQASNKSKQIKILADLNQVSTGEIRAVLAGAGIEGMKMPEKIMPRKQKPAVRPAAPQSVSVYDRIEMILSALPEDASGYAVDTARELAIALLREDLERRLGKAVQHDA